MTDFPLDFPTGIKIKSGTPRLMRLDATSSDPYTFKQQVYSWPGAKWVWDFEITPLTEDDGAEMRGFILALEGQAGSFMLGPRDAKAPRGTATAATVNGAVAERARVMNVDGMGAGKTLKRGDYFQLGNHLHMLRFDATANGGGAATLYFDPPAREAIADNTPLILNDAKGIWKLTASDTGWTVTAGPIYQISITCEEKL